jgi:4'-phosphopantetheinyl transferase
MIPAETGGPEDTWAPGPVRPVLADGAVHVWRADLAAVSPQLGGLLCEEERVRAERIVNKPDGELWRRSRGLLRTLLARYLQRDPSTLQFVTGEHGKPALVHGAEEPPAAGQPATAGRDRMSFNMSHSGHWALYAFSAAGAVGVDIEMTRRAVDAVAIAARMLGAEQAQRLQALDPASRQQEFIRAWARHEAELKCLGVGIGGGDASASPRPWVVQLELGFDAGAAVASERRALELRCWDW